MGSRYRDDSYPSSRDGGGRGGERWDRDRLESHGRGQPAEQRDRYEEDYYHSRESRREPSPKRYETKERVIYKERDRYDVPTRARDRFAFDEPQDTLSGALVHRPRDDDREIDIEIRRREYERPSRDFERPKFVRRQSSLDTYDRKPMPRYGDVARVREETIMVPAGRHRSPPRYREPPREEIYEEIYEDIRDDEYRPYQEREISRVRRNDHIDYDIEEPEDVRPKTGSHTKFPKHMVHTQALIDLGYEYKEDDTHVIVVGALTKPLIDEVVELSKGMNERRTETKTRYIIEGNGAGPVEERIVEKRTEIIREITPGALPSPDVPRSVREWDAMTRGTSRRSPSASRSPSPARTIRTRKSRARSTSGIHREIIISNDREESATIRAGVGALIVPKERRKSRDIRAEIRALELESKALKYEREPERERVRGNEMIVIKERNDEVVEVRRDKRGPPPRLIKAMLATLT